MNKFTNRLSGTHQHIRQSRAELASKQTAAAQDDLINSLRREVNQIELEIENHSDISPSQSTQLKLENFDSTEWVAKMHRLKVSILEKRVLLKIAEETKEEWFSTKVDQTPTASNEGPL